MDGGRIVSYLPLSHIAALSLDVLASMMAGISVYFTDQNVFNGTLKFYLEEVRPTFFIGVPRVFEKIQEKILLILSESNFIRRAIFSWASNKGK